MPTRLLAFVCGLALLAILAVAFEDANAARFGGGRSFGGRPSMSKPFTKPIPPASSPTMRQQSNQAQQPGAAAAAAAPGRSGLFGGMGGMLGGLLAGGLIGSLLFGGGMGAGGGFLDLLLLAGVLFLAFKFFARRRAASSAASGAAGGAGGFSSGGQESSPELRDVRYQAPASSSSSAPRGGMDWGALTGKPIPMAAPEAASADRVKVPAGFDEEEFLSGAKAAYGRLNSSWDKGDLADIAQFATPTFMKEIQEQAADRQGGTQTDIMLINASLVEVETVDNEQIASVYFNVLLREDPKADAPVDVREVWHFVRPANGEGSWRLDGIQQVEGA